MWRKLLIIFLCMLGWGMLGGASQLYAQEKQLYGVPDKAKMQRACKLTGGTWESLPRYCDNMHPRSWSRLTEEQKITCYDQFHEPCECGVGKRFSLQPRLGCVESRFQSDIWGG